MSPVVVTAWLLVMAPGQYSGYAVPALPTEQACRELGEKINQTKTHWGRFICLPYQSVVGARP